MNRKYSPARHTLALAALQLLSFAALAAEPAAEATPADPDRSKALEKVVVDGQSLPAEKARLKQKEAPNLVNLTTAEEMRKLPDVNIAEAVARLPGISIETDTGEGRFINIRGLDSDLNSTTFSGLRLLPSNTASPQGGGRAVALDAIPAGLVGSITVTKTNLPEQDAEALGGTIELGPRTLPLNRAAFVEGHVGTGYESLRGTKIGDVTVSAGTRFGMGNSGGGIDSYSDKPFSIVVTAAYYEDRRGIDDVEPGYIDDGVNPAMGLANIDLRRYQYHRVRHGYGLDLGYQPDARNSYYVRAFDAGYTEAKQDSHLNITLNGSPVAGSGGTLGDSAVQFDTKLTDEKEVIDNKLFVLGGRNELGSMVLDYRLGYAQGSYHELYNYGSDFRFVPANAPTLSYSNSGEGSTPLFSGAGTDYLNAANYTLKKLSNATAMDKDEEYSGAVNLKTPVNWGDFEQESMKLGLGTRARTRTQNSGTQSFPGLPKLPLSNFAATGNFSYYNGQYLQPALVQGGVLQSQFAANATVTSDDLSNAQLAYAHDKETVSAAYAQYQFSHGGWTVTGGLRLEHTQAQYDANSQGVDADGNNIVLPTSVQHSYNNLFPSAQARYEIDPRTNLRLSYSSTIARPGFNQINPQAQVSLDPNGVSIGNPDLKPITANSFDLAWEHYLPHGGILAAGLFDKELSNYIVTASYSQTFPQTGIYAGLVGPAVVSSYVNAPSGHARGLELNYEQRLADLPALLEGLGLGFNYTYVDSAAMIHPGVNSLLPSTSRHSANAALFYEHEGVRLRLGVNYVSSSLWAIGGNATTPDTYSDARLAVDFGGSVEISKQLSFYFNGKNLTNTPLKFYEGTPNRPIQREFYGPTYQAGLNFSY